MVRVFLVGLGALCALSACGETERAPKTSAAGGSAGSGAVAQPAGEGGVAGEGPGEAAPFATAIAECVHYCETLDYILPHALCEDWHLPEWDPQFCHLRPTMGCSDYCTAVYETVQPTCAPTLPPVIRCVSSTYERAALPSAGECWLEDCRDLLFTMTSACYGLREKLAAARATWEASGVANYDLQYPVSDNAMAKVVVRAGSEPTVTPPGAVPWTVPKLFDQVESNLNAPGGTAKAAYDPTLGYVVFVGRQQGCSEYVTDALGEIVVTPQP